MDLHELCIITVCSWQHRYRSCICWLHPMLLQIVVLYGLLTNLLSSFVVRQPMIQPLQAGQQHGAALQDLHTQLAAARGETRPGPVHLNLPWREPLAPLPVEGAVTATDPLALEGREGRPLTAVTSIDLEPSAFLLDEMAGHIGDAIAGVIIAGRQLDVELREPGVGHHLQATQPIAGSRFLVSHGPERIAWSRLCRR